VTTNRNELNQKFQVSGGVFVDNIGVINFHRL
jgi:hypothetical protein